MSQAVHGTFLSHAASSVILNGAIHRKVHASFDLLFSLGSAQQAPPGFRREPAHFLPWSRLVCFSFLAWYSPLVAPDLHSAPQDGNGSHGVICLSDLGGAGNMEGSDLLGIVWLWKRLVCLKRWAAPLAMLLKGSHIWMKKMIPVAATTLGLCPET